jgi:hypothetical protein
MFLRGVLKRSRERRGGAAVHEGSCTGASCDVSVDLLAELAADAEDFADVAAVLGVDLRTVATTLTSAAPPRSPAALVAALTAHAVATAAVVALPLHRATPSGGEEAVGWGRWTRARGGARVHRDIVVHEARQAARPAMAAS